jgi:hypothetical protein
MMIHIFQMEGVSDSKDKLPGWRQPLIDHLTSVAIFIKRIKSAIIVIAVKDSHWPTQKYIRYQTSTNFQQFTTRENTLISQQTEW